MTCNGSRLILLLALVFMGSITKDNVLADDRRNDPKRLTVMTINAEFMWDGVPPEEGKVNFPRKGNKAKAEEHMAKIAAVIRLADPDIVNLCEVENLHALWTLNDKFLNGCRYRPYLKKGSDIATGQNMGLLTRIDPMDGTTEFVTRAGQSQNVLKSVSKNSVARFSVNGKRIGLIGVHLRAQPTSVERKPMREAQANAIVQIARGLKDNGYSLIILGDLNDYDGNVDALDHVDSRPITNVLSSIRALDETNPDDDLRNAASFLPKAERYTCFWDKDRNGKIGSPEELTSIDHILLSRDLASRIESVQILHDHDPKEGTDHFPVVVKVLLGNHRNR